MQNNVGSTQQLRQRLCLCVLDQQSQIKFSSAAGLVVFDEPMPPHPCILTRASCILELALPTSMVVLLAACTLWVCRPVGTAHCFRAAVGAVAVDCVA